MSEDYLQRVNFLELCREAVNLAPEGAARTTRRVGVVVLAEDPEIREQNLQNANVEGVITELDWRAVVADTLDLSTHPMRAVRRWVHIRGEQHSKPIAVVVMLGLTGRGKTIAGAWLLASLGGVYITAEELCRLMASNYAASVTEFDRVMRARVLFIDEIGFEEDAAKAAGMLFRVINRRQGLLRGWTLLAGNLALATKDGTNEFLERYGERTVKRIEHVGYFVEVDGDDLRRRGK